MWTTSSVMHTHIIPCGNDSGCLHRKIILGKYLCICTVLSVINVFPSLKNKTLALSAFVLHLLPFVLFLLAGNENNSWLSVDCQWSVEDLKASIIPLKLLFKNNSVPVHVKSCIILSSDHNCCSERTRLTFYLCQYWGFCGHVACWTSNILCFQPQRKTKSICLKWKLDASGIMIFTQSRRCYL